MNPDDVVEARIGAKAERRRALRVEVARPALDDAHDRRIRLLADALDRRITRDAAQRLTTALERLHLPLDRPDASQVDTLIDAMRADKKVRAGEIRLALPSKIGVVHGNDADGWTVAVSESSVRQVLVNR